jgi:hypothetical protein
MPLQRESAHEGEDDEALIDADGNDVMRRSKMAAPLQPRAARPAAPLAAAAPRMPTHAVCLPNLNCHTTRLTRTPPPIPTLLSPIALTWQRETSRLPGCPLGSGRRSGGSLCRPSRRPMIVPVSRLTASYATLRKSIHCTTGFPRP